MTTKVQPQPYSIASGAIAYALAITFHKHLDPQVLAAAPAALTAIVAAVEVAYKQVSADVVKVVQAAHTAATATDDAKKAIATAAVAVEAAEPTLTGRTAPHAPTT